MKGEVWRLISFAILPPTLRPLLLVFILFFMVFMGEMLERMWGSFRLTLYVLAGVVGIVAGSFFAPRSPITYARTAPGGTWVPISIV